MNRRTFLTAIAAAPVVAMLPDIRRPTFPHPYTGGTINAAEAWAIDKASRLAQNAMETAVAVSRALAEDAGANGIVRALAAAHHGRVVNERVMCEAPPWADTVVSRTVPRGLLTRDALPVRVLVREVARVTLTHARK